LIPLDLIPFFKPIRTWKTEFLYYRLLAIPPEPPVAKIPLFMAARRRDGLGASQPFPLPTADALRAEAKKERDRIEQINQTLHTATVAP